MVLVAAVAPSRAQAEEDLPSRVWVQLTAEPGTAQWRADALEASIEATLARYRRLAIVRDKTNADILFIGRVGLRELTYELHETWTPARVDHGVMEIGVGSTVVSLEQQVLRSLRPFLTSGGLLDQHRYAVTRPAPSRPGAGLAIALAAAALLLLLPPIVGTSAIRRNRRRLIRKPSVYATFRLLPLMLGLAAGITFAPLDPSWASSEWIAGAGGLVAGWLLFDLARFAFPAFAGLDRVRHHDVFHLVTQWTRASLGRVMIIVVYYAPFVAAAVWLVPSHAMLMVPSAAALARFWITSWVECLTPFVDDRLVEGPANRRNPWHAEIKRYFLGYVRRCGWAIDRAALDRILFLPGTTEGVCVYSGRIVVDRRLLDIAMGPIQSERATETVTEVDWPDWSVGVVTPQPKAPKSSRSVRSPTPKPAPTKGPRRPLGQAATLLGYVVPLGPNETLPLISDDDADLDAVRELLAEHYPWFAPDPDEEYDDSDPTDKDFLFGPLARAVGDVERRDDQPATLVHALRAVGPAASSLVGRLARRLWARAATITADGYAALNFARDHLIQYLYLRETGNIEALTTRADEEELFAASVRLLRKIEQRSESPSSSLHLRRLIWLSRMFPEPIEEPHDARRRWVTASALALAAVIGVGVATYRALSFHPTYVKRIEERKAEPDGEQR